MYTLGDITLPNPKSMEKRIVETAAYITTLNGTTKKDITNRKYEYSLVYEFLSQSEINQIMGEIESNEARYFEISETNLTVNATLVIPKIETRQHNLKGTDYREDVVLILTEVS